MLVMGACQMKDGVEVVRVSVVARDLEFAVVYPKASLNFGKLTKDYWVVLFRLADMTDKVKAAYLEF